MTVLYVVKFVGWREKEMKHTFWGAFSMALMLQGCAGKKPMSMRMMMSKSAIETDYNAKKSECNVRISLMLDDKLTTFPTLKVPVGKEGSMVTRDKERAVHAVIRADQNEGKVMISADISVNNGTHQQHLYQLTEECG